MIKNKRGIIFIKLNCYFLLFFTLILSFYHFTFFIIFYFFSVVFEKIELRNSGMGNI